MGYVENNLMSGEKVLYRGKVHWFVYVPAAIFWFLSISIMFDSEAAPVVVIIAPIAIFFTVRALIVSKSTEVAVTTRRIIAKTGFLRTSTIELNHQKVESFAVNQGLAGNVFGFGTITINGTGGIHTPIKNIADPLQFRRKAMEAIDGKQNPVKRNPAAKQEDDQPIRYVIK